MNDEPLMLAVPTGYKKQWNQEPIGIQVQVEPCGYAILEKADE
jgi:hypothetical protein